MIPNGKKIKEIMENLENEIIEAVQDKYREGYENGKSLIKLEELFGKGFQDGKEEGMRVAWQAARKISLPTKNGGLSTDALDEIFGSVDDIDILRTWGPEEVIAKIKVYEENQIDNEEIKVGDEVEYSNGIKGIVSRIGGGAINVMWSDGSCGYYPIGTLKMTGTHYPSLDRIFELLRNEE